VRGINYKLITRYHITTIGEKHMRKLTQLALTAALGLAIAFTLSCSGDDGGGGGNGSNTIKKARITGAFQKGPFVEGTTATLNELDYNLNPTGRPYSTLITDKKGTFTLRDVELVSPYAHLIATGFFLNEVTSRKSDAQITLQAIVDVTDKEQVNVNILTHLEYYRVLDLVDGGMTIKAAKKQAQKEILAVFGIGSDSFSDSEDMSIFGTSESDAALLAVSVMLLGNLGEADFTQRLMNFSQAIRENGTWDNDAEKAKMADAASGNKEYKDIKDNILAWGLSTEVPEFGKYMYNYWITNWGFGNCSGENDGLVKERKYKADYGHPLPYGTELADPYICKDGVWRRAEDREVICDDHPSIEGGLPYCLGGWRARTVDEFREYCRQIEQEVRQGAMQDPHLTQEERERIEQNLLESLHYNGCPT
jgi:hypothetical protein